MKAIQLIKYGEADNAFQIVDTNISDPLAEEVQIEVEQFGLNYADVQARKGLYGEAPSLPCVLGYEVVGKIIKVGSEVEEKWKGKRVVAFTRFGGYSQLVNASIYGIAEIKDYDGGKALCLATQYVTAYYMSHVASNIHKGDDVLIHAAAGGVGTALIQLLKERGANIIAKIGEENKRPYLEELGIKHIINYKKQDYAEEVRKILGGNRLAASFNPAAGSTYKKDLKLIQPTGKLILFGASELSHKYGIFSKLNFVRKMGLLIPIGLMMQSKSIIGINMLRVAERQPLLMQECLEKVVEMALSNQLNPIVGRSFKAEEIKQAHAFLGSGRSTGKVVCTW